MNDDLKASKVLLDDFLAEVNKLEGTLSGGTKIELGKGGNTVRSLRETKIELGNPRDKFIRLTPGLFKEAGFTPGEIQKRQQSTDYNYYYITVPVNLFGAPGVQFDDLICDLQFGPKGKNEPIIQAKFPTGEWHDVLSIGAGTRLTVNAGYDFGVGLNAKKADLVRLQQVLPGSIAGNVQSQNKIKGVVVVPDFKFTIGRKEIAAPGGQNSHCRWIISSPKLHEADDIEFGIIFKIPKGCKSFQLTATILAEPSLSWLASQLRHVASALSQKFRDVLDGTGSALVYDAEKWSFKLDN